MQKKEIVLAMMAAAVLTAGTAQVAHAGGGAGCLDSCAEKFGHIIVYADESRPMEVLDSCTITETAEGTTTTCYYTGVS
jgi:hypothetical protein